MRSLKKRSWDRLYELAAAQSGWFTGQQAGALGFSDQLLSKHIGAGNLERGLRGIYRIARFPPAEHEDLVVAWLWSRQEGVISHESALQLHALSDAMPARHHLTLPAARRRSRRRIPEGVLIHYADLEDRDRTWSGPVPVTTPARAVREVASAHGDAVLVEQAIEQGIRRDLFPLREVASAAGYVASFQQPGATRVFPEAAADLGDACYLTHVRGQSAKPPPSDWPALAATIAGEHNGRLYSQQHFPRDHSLLLGLVWPLPGPGEETLNQLRTALKEAFSWQ